jgi:hypothetical protein
MPNKNWKRSALMLVLVTSVWGCTAQNRDMGLYAVERAHIAQMDDFNMLLMKAGVDAEDFPAGDALSVQQANDLLLWLRFKISDGNVPAYGPRIMASFLLEEGLKTGDISRRALIRSLHLHTSLTVLNPEGHLVMAYSGAPLRCVGPLHIQNGVPTAGAYRVDAFYVQEGDTFRQELNLVAPAIFIPPPPPPRPPGQQLAGAEAK